MAKGKTFTLHFVLFLIFSTLILSACILDTEGELQSWDWFISYDGTGQWQKIEATGASPLSTRIGGCCTVRRPEACSPTIFEPTNLFQHFPDFNANGATEVFSSQNGKWYYSNITGNSGGPWQFLKNSNVKAFELQFGDFNKDCITDVFSTWGGNWHVSLSGTNTWQTISGSDVAVSDLRLGDFNGDGRTDLFTTWGGNWRVSLVQSSGQNITTSSWQIISGSDVDVSDLRLGDFNGDGITDVFSAWGGNWYVSVIQVNGQNVTATSWQNISGSNVSLSDLRFGDFNGDGRTDIFATWGGKWRVSYTSASGNNVTAGTWQIINTSNYKVGSLRFGDFNGNGITDVFRVSETSY